MIRIGLIDDDPNHLSLLRTFLLKYEQEKQIRFSVQEYQNGLNFVEDYDGTLDVVFLDIEMPHMDGMTAARTIRERDSSLGIVFVTNMAQYAIHGYEVNAIDFIVKPVSYYVFADKLEKAIRFAQLHSEEDFVIQTDDAIVRITSSKILYIEKDKNYLIFHTQMGTYRARGTMIAMEERFQKSGFSKCISGCLINLKYVTRLTKDTVWVGDTQLPVSRQRRKEFKEDFMKYLGGDY